MYAPPRRILNPDGTENWLDELGDELEEQMPCRRPIPDKEYDVVHFDLDPQNGRLCLSPKTTACLKRLAETSQLQYLLGILTVPSTAAHPSSK